MPVHFDLPDTGISFFSVSLKGKETHLRDTSFCVCGLQILLARERERERERKELRSFVIGFRLLEDMAPLLTKMGSSAQGRMLSDFWKRGLTTAVQQEVLPELPYDYNAMQPVISAEIMLLHHQKHHQAFVTGFNKALEQLTTASDPRAIVALQSAINFNGGGNAPGLIFGVHPVSINLCILIQYPIVP
jgi:hypothetical protein